MSLAIDVSFTLLCSLSKETIRIASERPTFSSVLESTPNRAILITSVSYTHLAKILPYRSNIPYLSQFCFAVCDETFAKRAKEAGKGIVCGGSNYGQGSSREHAALVPLYLGVKAVLVKSFARIHRSNLINAGILPLTFANEADYSKISQGDSLELANVRDCIMNDKPIFVTNLTTGEKIPVNCDLSGRARDIILAGGLLNYTKEQNQ